VNKDTAIADLIRQPVLALVVEALLPAGDIGRALLRRHGVTAKEAMDLYALTPLPRYVALFEEAAEVLGEPYLGLRLARNVCPTSLGPLGVAVMNQPTLRKALKLVCSHIASLQGGTSTDLSEEEDIAFFNYRIVNPKIWPRRQDTEFSIGATCSIIRSLIGSSWRPLEVHFEHRRPASSRALEAFFGVAPRFGEPSNRLVIAREQLDEATHSNFAASETTLKKMMPFIERHLDDLLMEARPDDFISKVAANIERRLGREPVSVEDIAGDMGLTTRTFQRELSMSGTSYVQILKEYRLVKAKLLLTAKVFSVAEIAGELGYSDETAFCRAFKAWTGRSPRDDAN